MPDPYAVCDGLACAELVMYKERRTVVLAEDAFESPSRLRASLLEIWERYQNPRPGSLPDRARGALRVVQDGPGVGVTEIYLRRQAQHLYRQLYDQLAAAEQAKLVDPDSIPVP